MTDPPYAWAFSAARADIIQATPLLDKRLRPKDILSSAMHPGLFADTVLGVRASNELALMKDGALEDFVMNFVLST